MLTGDYPGRGLFLRSLAGVIEKAASDHGLLTVHYTYGRHSPA